MRRANDLDGRAWLRNSISVWSDIRRTSEEAKLDHPATFPSALVTRLLECFTTEADQVILDPFAGVGTTVVAAAQMGKTGIGLELYQHFIEVAEARLAQPTLFRPEGHGIIHRADAHALLDFVEPASVDMAITSPPYWDILHRRRTADGKAAQHYGDGEQDIGNIEDYGLFLTELQRIFALVYQALKPNKYCVVVVADLRKKSTFYPLHADVAAFMQELGFIYDDLIIWDRRHEYNNLRPLGYPSVFRINRVHEYLLIFQRREKRV